MISDFLAQFYDWMAASYFFIKEYFLIFYFWLFFFDQHSVWERKGNEDTIESLEKEKAYFIEKIETDKNRIHELKTNRKNLEKFAREQYLMKKTGEDIFIMIEEE